MALELKDLKNPPVTEIRRGLGVKIVQVEGGAKRESGAVIGVSLRGALPR